MIRLLVTDRDSNKPFWYEDELKAAGLKFESMLADNEEKLLETLNRYQPQIVLLNTAMPFSRDASFLARLYPVPIIMLLNTMDMDIVVTCMRAGAQDCVVREEKGRLATAVQDALKRNGVPSHPSHLTVARQEENDLRTDMNRIKLVLESGDVAVFDLDMVHDSTWRTLKHDHIYGFDTLQPHWKMDDFNQFVVPEDSKAVTSYMEKAIKEGQYHFECRIHRLDHQIRWIYCQGSVFHDEQGNPVRMIGTLRDITERKQNELALQKRAAELETVNRIMSQMYRGRNIRELLQVLMDETLSAISFTDGCILLHEPEKKVLEPVVTRGWFNSIKGHSMAEAECISGHVFTEDKLYISDDILLDKFISADYKKFIPPAQTGAYLPIHDSEGKLGVIAVACELPRRITEDEVRLLTIISRLAGNSANKIRLYEEIHYSYEELQKEVVLRKITQNLYAAEKEILSTTLMSIAEGVVTTDEDGLVILFNQAAESILGYRASEVLEKPVHTVMRILDTDTNQVIANTIERLIEMDQKQLNEGLTYRSPTVLTKTGEKVLLGGSISSVKSSDGNNIGHVIVFQNVTEKQMMEAQNLLSTKMEAIGQLAAGIAHEINTPVQYIGDNLSYIQRVLSKYTDMLQAYQDAITQLAEKGIPQQEVERLESLRKKYRIERYRKEAPMSLEEAMEGVQRVQKIVTAVREFSHPSQKEKQMADINHGIETTVTISRNEWKYHADLETDLDPDLPPVVCQIDEINQVILNMIVNAAQAIEEKMAGNQQAKGRISIRTRKSEGGKHILITIRDSGAGIPEEIRERIYDPFFTTKGVGKGTGQGLSMAYNIIVKKHNGTMRVDSQVGEGTTFTIELPLQSEEV